MNVIPTDELNTSVKRKQILNELPNVPQLQLTTVTAQNGIHEEMKSRLNSENACYH